MKNLLNFTKKAAAVVLGIACFAQVAHADALADIKARKKVLVAIDLGAPPFGMTSAKLEPQGSDVETARALAKDLGVELEIVQVTGPNRIPFLMTGKADMVIASFSITPERQKVVSFSQPYGASQFVVAAPKGENIKGLNDLVGKRVAVVRGNMQDSLLTPIAPKGATIVRFDDDATVTAAIVSGQVDAFCTPNSLASAVSKQNPSKNIETKFVIKDIPYAIGIRKNEPALEKWLNDWIGANLKNGKLAGIYQQWVGSPMPDLSQFAAK
ncbi:transporter substrate-binding domain-containing protein [Herbaspirillum chlorophenolicum]|jgi:polar amino acid transport system substrate-binding protein|uniref:Transporter substrate-binding domain-containing protein n=1 Tax=Herbaspirillum chlorophenolicum TaxID=211589 RepID=A0ABW8F459_9BURK|nr:MULTISPECIES: transporter substrate-binding domain-containing protein [Herbaspirillum]MBB5391656.1 polar amino acid transport system substrate-binding protein [Herbaspirillum sp. SJZ102]TQK12663.1 amino acid ABC transporter substrate-binding protein (PAAT family) [Herbaspirillum sp. SJZ130]TQK14667.1 amino acid ABC transporter substrate-binding protein (PAAT family) [Herbaspirillum sp. SJZ106]TWC62753.1 amino acid ABC transporter substrate-binding protein (PAAT family) [Herbaspirillum sp. SJ